MRGAVVLPLALLACLAFGAQALAGPPNHSRDESRDLSGFNKACGVAVDSQGDVYVASAGESKIRIFDSSHAEFVSAVISNSNEPCGLAVNSKGELFVSEKALGKVVRYKPTVPYPFTGAPAYGPREEIDASSEARGIAIDPNDDRLYVARGTKIAVYKADGSFEANIGEGDLTNATGVAAYSYVKSKPPTERAERYVIATDDGASAVVKIFSGEVQAPKTGAVANPKLRRTISGVDHDRNPETADQSFDFGPAGAHLAVDQGNRRTDNDTCTAMFEPAPSTIELKQACTAGHFLLYDDANEAVNEFEATGGFLDQFTDDALADAEPTGMAIDRSGGAGNGTIYVSSGAGPNAEVLAFEPLTPPSRTPQTQLSERLNNQPTNEQLKTPKAVTTDFYGGVYVAAGAVIRVFDNEGTRLTQISDPRAVDLAVDSECNVYVLDEETTVEQEVTYYAPSSCPPTAATTYTRHPDPVAAQSDFFSIESDPIKTVAINPGPGPDSDHLFATSLDRTREYDSAEKGSTLLDPEFASGLPLTQRRSMDVYGVNGDVYFAGNGLISIVDAAGTEIVNQFNGAGCPRGLLPTTPSIAVDQSNGHVLAFALSIKAAREYEPSGSCVAEFGAFTDVFKSFFQIAVDSACALHEPPLTEATIPTCESFDPSSGNTYVAFEDPAVGAFDLTAFGPLTYGEAPLAETGIASDIGAGDVTLNGTVDPRGFEVEECSFQYTTDADFQLNGFALALSADCVPDPDGIGSETGPVPVSAGVSGLDHEERYRFRLVAGNKFDDTHADPWLFGPPIVAPKSAMPILYDEATLRAEIDPSGLETEYHFEYGRAPGEYDQSTPPAQLPPGDGPVAVEAALTGLAEGATYFFRVVAENDALPVSGPEGTFETRQRRAAEACPNNAEFRTGFSTSLPDCRVYELVTPAETSGRSPAAAGAGNAGADFNNFLVAPRGPGAGESLAYFTNGTLPGFDGNGYLDGYRAARTHGEGPHPKGGWKSELFAPSYPESAASFSSPANQQGVSSDQLYSFWKISPDEIFEETLPAGVYLRTPEGVADTECGPGNQPGHFELVGCGSIAPPDPNAQSRYVSPGGAHVIFVSDDHLEPQAAPASTATVYDRAAGASSAQVVSVKPNGDPFAAGQGASYVGATEDGSAILFRVGGVLYLRRAGQTIEVAPSPNAFAGISADGGRVFYADASDGGAPASLFAFDVETASIVPIATDSIFVHVSLDGSHVYFTSTEVLDDAAQGTLGADNLYLWDGSEIRFIAIADPQDFTGFGGTGVSLDGWIAAINPGTLMGRAISTTRATPDGAVFLFQSHAQLTPYDNEGHGEIYRYEAAAPPPGRLLCVSCDPSGTLPSDDAMLQTVGSTLAPLMRTSIVANLTDDGQRVFFESPDPLVPEDANEVLDVYEWQAQGEGGCKRPAGCLALISSGQGEADSHLFGMSASGDDVFFRTREKLVGADVPGSPSLYDARVGGGIPEPLVQEPCEGDACQGQGSAPPSLPAPTSTVTGDGVKQTKPRRCPKGKRKVRRAGRVRCVRRDGKRRGTKRSPARAGRDGERAR